VDNMWLGSEAVGEPWGDKLGKDCNGTGRSGAGDAGGVCLVSLKGGVARWVRVKKRG